MGDPRSVRTLASSAEAESSTTTDIPAAADRRVSLRRSADVQLATMARMLRTSLLSPAQKKDSAPAPDGFAEPWNLDDWEGTMDVLIKGVDGSTVLEVMTWSHNRIQALQTIRRVLACVNYCEGLNTEWLEEMAGQLDGVRVPEAECVLTGGSSEAELTAKAGIQ